MFLVCVINFVNKRISERRNCVGVDPLVRCVLRKRNLLIVWAGHSRTQDTCQRGQWWAVVIMVSGQWNWAGVGHEWCPPLLTWSHHVSLVTPAPPLSLTYILPPLYTSLTHTFITYTHHVKILGSACDKKHDRHLNPEARNHFINSKW